MASTTVNFNLKTAGYVNYANQTLTFRLLTAGAEAATGDQSYLTLPGVVTATSAANGDGSVSLFRNGKSGIESVYEVILPNREKAKFIIPSGSATIELATLLVDHVPSGVNVQQSSVYAEAIKRANHTGTQLLSTLSDASTVQLKPSEGAFANGDKTKLNGIEAGATTDQTNAEIRAAVEAATDSNVFTDDDHTKLNGIEASATTDQTASEIRALVESATDSNVFTDADHTKLNGIAGSTTEEIQDIVGAMVDGGTETRIAVTYDDTNGRLNFVADSQTDQNFTTADHSKLDGIEASATADQTASEIRTLVESATDSNVFTDADHTKLNGLDANAKAQVNFVPRSITFTNTSAYLSLADAAVLDVDAGDFSLSFWARLDSSGTEPVLTKLSGTGYRLKFVSGSLILTMQDSGGSADFTLATGLADNKWHVYVVTVDRNGNIIAYVDNVAQTGVTASVAGDLGNGGQFQIGSDGGSNAGDGIALGNYVALHKAVLTASQAAQIYFSADAALTAVAPTLMVDLRKSDKTFTDVGPSGLAVTTNGTIIFNESRLTEFTGTNLLATATLGYTTGSGGTVTQASNKTTAVTLNKINGEIVMNAAALADDATAAFTLTNSTIAATDVVIVNVASVGTAGAYQVTVGAVAAGSCSISVLNVSGGALSEAIKLNFAVIKAVAS